MLPNMYSIKKVFLLLDASLVEYMLMYRQLRMEGVLTNA
jgi:hypothetical protein